MKSPFRKGPTSFEMDEARRLMEREEIESDEAGTAFEKALRIVMGKNPIPPHLIISGA